MLALAAAGAALAGVPTAASAPTTAAVIGEGPGGREALASWTLALDARNRGLAAG